MSDSANLAARVLTSAVVIVFGYLQFTNIGTYATNPAIVKFGGLARVALADGNCLSGRNHRSVRRIAHSRRLPNALGCERADYICRTHADLCASLLDL